jgi:four helix bundle protein
MKASSRPHKNLRLWQKAIDFVVQVYEVTKGFPRNEEFGLTSQLRRAAISVPSNIAEGLTRRTRNDKLHYLNIAQASLSEIDAQLEIARRLGYIDEASFEGVESSMTDVYMLLSGLIRSLR